MIRLAVRCAPEQADLVLAELTVLAPNGVEEERGPGYVEYAIYGGEGELPELGEIDAVVGGRPIEVSSTEVPDDWACPDCGVRDKVDFEAVSGSS